VFIIIQSHDKQATGVHVKADWQRAANLAFVALGRMSLVLTMRMSVFILVILFVTPRH
jgi:hypothetical protein